MKMYEIFKKITQYSLKKIILNFLKIIKFMSDCTEFWEKLSRLLRKL